MADPGVFGDTCSCWCHVCPHCSQPFINLKRHMTSVNPEMTT
jgi:hypothetical protein